MADSFIEQLLDPRGAEIPHESLWAAFGVSMGCVAVGVVLLFLGIRTLGKPGGQLSPQDLGLGLGLAITAFLVYLVMGSALRDAPLASGAMQATLTLGCILLLAHNPLRQEARARPEWLGARPSRLAVTPVVWLVSKPVLLAAMFGAVALAQLIGMPVTEQQPIQDLRSNDSPLWIAGWYVKAAVAAPLLEEFVFRLVLFGGLMGLMQPLSKAEGWRHPGVWVALVVSGGLFVLAHGVTEWTVGIIPLSVLTFVLSALYLHTRSIWPPVLLHAIHNGFVVTIQFFVLM